jgi:nitrogen-specific signal transduction histidine kinase
MYFVHKSTSKHFHESEKLLSLFINSIEEGLIYLKELKIFRFNDIIEQMVSNQTNIVSSVQHINDVLCAMLTAPNEKSKDFTPLMDVISKGVDMQCYGLIQTTIYYQITVKHLRINGLLHSLVIVKDIRHIKDLEEQVEFTNYKNLLVATASHEFRTPLNGILGMLTVLENYINEEGKYFLRVATNSSTFLLNLINDMLDFSQIESKKFRISKGPFEIRKMLYEVIQLVSFQPQQRGVKLLCEIDDHLPQYCHYQNYIL